MSLPLPLVPFEDYMLFDDRPTHPMTFFLRLRFSGDCDSRALDTSLRRILLRHPLLSATAQKVGWISFCWQPLDHKQAAVRWQAQSNGERSQAAYLDLSSRSGLEVIGTRTTTGTDLLFQFHHSCCDAIGGMRLIEEVLVGYADELNGSTTPYLSADIANDALEHRAKFGLTGWDLLHKSPKQAIGILRAQECLLRIPTSLAPVCEEQLEAPLPMPYPTSVEHEFSMAETQRISAAAKQQQTTFNNLLVGALFIAIENFREEQGNTHPRRWVRLSIPMNLRRPGAEGPSAANYVSMVFLDRRPKAIRNEGDLFAGIQRQMTQNKKNDLGLTLPLMLRLIKPLGIISLMKDDVRCRSTAVLSNLIRPLNSCPLPRQEGKIVAGNLKLEGLDFMPPVRPKTNAAFGVLTYANRLSVTQHYDSRVISAGEAQRLLDLYVERILLSC